MRSYTYKVGLVFIVSSSSWGAVLQSVYDCMITLESGINVQSEIMIRVGKFGQNNNSTVLNKHTGGKNFAVKYSKKISFYCTNNNVVK